MSLKFGLRFENRISPQWKFQNHSVRDVVDDVLTPFTRMEFDDSFELTASMCPRQRDTQHVAEQRKREYEFQSVRKPLVANPRYWVENFNVMRANEHRAVDLLNSPVDLELTIKKAGCIRTYARILVSDLFPPVTDYFFNPVERRDRRKALGDKLHQRLFELQQESH